MSYDHCTCNHSYSPGEMFESRYLGTDEQEGRFGDVHLKKCQKCGAFWLWYYYTIEGISHSGRWWLAKISEEDALAVTVYNAIRIIERQDFYFVGGSYYNGETHRTSGTINEATPKERITPSSTSFRSNYSNNDEIKNDDEYDDLRDLFYP